RDQFESRIAVLAPPEDPVEVRSDPNPPVFASFEPKRKRPPAAAPGPAAEAAAAVPGAAAAPTLADGLEVSTPSACAPEPAAPAPAPQPAESEGQPAAAGGTPDR